MTLASLLKNKKQKKDILLREYGLTDSKKPLGLILLRGNLINDILLNSFKILPANFIIVTEEINKNFDNISFSKGIIQDLGFDFIVCDKCEENLMKFLNIGIIPIISKNHHMSTLLEEFNAKKVEGTAFIFENNELCDVYYAIIRFLENYKFPYDHKALVKNVLAV